jgi:hypothetical protein
MKRSLCIIFFFIVFIITHLQAQRITLIGKVVDEYDEPLTGASVFFEGTTIGSSTDIDGLFQLTIENKINASFAISFIGYQTKIFDDYGVFLSENPFKVVLPSSPNVLKEVVIQEPLFSQESFMNSFKENFIGDEKFWKECRILNEDDLRFKYDKTSKTFSASSYIELQIENDYLGYKIYYTLVDFQAVFSKITLNQNNLKAVFFAGISRYVETKSSRLIYKRRERAYENSSLQFFRWLAKANWKDRTFELFDLNKSIDFEEYFSVMSSNDRSNVTVFKHQKALQPSDYISDLQILHKRNIQSQVIFKTDSFFIDKYGLNTNIDKIIFSGAITQKRMSEMLPLDYGINL